MILFTPDNALTPIYRFGLFNRVAQPGISFTRPFIEKVGPSLSTKIHVFKQTFKEVPTNDEVPFKVDMTFLFSLDPTIALPQLLPQVVNFTPAIMNAIVSDFASGLLRDWFSENSAAQIGTGSVRRRMSRQLNRLLALKMVPLGLRLLPNDGVIINEIVPHAEYRKSRLAVKQQEALLEMFNVAGSERKQELAILIQLLQEVQKGGNVTTFLPSLEQFLRGSNLFSTGQRHPVPEKQLNGNGRPHA